MRLSEFDIGWVVGLLEGDGTFTFDGRFPVVALKITDFDTAQRFAFLMETTVSGPYHYENAQLGQKPYYMTKIVGRRARQFMTSTLEHFCERRRAQICALLGTQLPISVVDRYVPRVSPDLTRDLFEVTQ